jgi:hypothetical protein
VPRRPDRPRFPDLAHPGDALTHEPPDPGNVLTPDRLAALAATVDAAHGTEPGNLVVQASLVGHDEVELTLRPLGGLHPLEALLGWRAPLGCDVVGVRATGRAQRLDHPGPGAAEAVAITFLAGRTGDDAGILRRGSTATPMPPDSAGLVVDGCRRALGRPTDPPPPSTLPLFTAVWLDRVMAMAATDPGRPDWAAAARAHPALEDDDEPPCLHPRALAAAAVEHADRHPWPALRTQPWQTGLGRAAPSARLAAWMDDGSFARWTLASLPSTADLLADLGRLLSPGVVDAVATTVADISGCD